MMGKFSNNRNIEIIPLDTSNTLVRSKPLNMQRMPYLSDPSIVPRVQKVNKLKIIKASS